MAFISHRLAPRRVLVPLAPWLVVAGLGGCGPAASSDSGGPLGGGPAAGGLSSSGGAGLGGGSGGISSASGGVSSGGASGGAQSAGGNGPSGGSSSGGGAANGGSSGGGAADGGGPGSGGGPSVGGGPGTGGAESAGCESSSIQAGDSTRMLTLGGQQRSFLVHVPASYSGAQPVPLVLDFHGLGGNGSQQKGSSGFAKLSDSEGFIALWPNGLDNAWNIGKCCTNSRDVDDVGFAKAMVEDLGKVACIDMRRVYSTGFSNGGGMSNYLACHAADVFAAIAPSAFDLTTDDESTCIPSRPISVFSMRGTNDNVVPYAGGPGSSGILTFLGAEGTFEKWGELMGCTGANTTANPRTYASCDAGVEVKLLVNQGGGHAAGPADQAWSFLKQKTLP